MKLEFTYLQINGFKSFARDKPTILDYGNYGVGLHFIRGLNKVYPQLGPNGVGKSSLHDALTWVLYGRTIEGLRNPDVRPWFGTAQTRVELGFVIDDHPYKLVRAIGPVTRVGSLTLDGKTISQPDLERLIGMSLDTFLHTIVFGQGQDLFLDLTPARKMDVFSTVLNLDRWEDRARRAGDQVVDLMEKLQHHERDADMIATRKKQLSEMIHDTKVKLAEWTSKRKGAEDKLRADLKRWKDKGTKAGEEYDDWDAKYDSALTELRALMKTQKDIDVKYQHALSEVFRLRDAIASPDKCPTCGQTIKGHAAHVRKLEKEYKKADAIKDEHLKAVARLEQAQKEFKTKADQAESERDSFARVVNECDAQINLLKTTLEERVTNPFREQLKEYREARDKTSLELDASEVAIKVLQRKIARRQLWTKAFKDIRLEIIQTTLQELELTSNALLAELGLGDWQMQYAIERETKSGTVKREMNVAILSPNNKQPVNWHSWSGGERQRLRLVGALALSQVLLNHAGVQTALRVFDEPDSHLSTVGIASVVDMLAEHARMTNSQIFFSSHNVIESAQFASVITVIRSDAGSLIQSPK